MGATTKTPMKMRFHWKHVAETIQDLEEKQERIEDALRQLRPLVGQPAQTWNGPDRRAT